MNEPTRDRCATEEFPHGLRCMTCNRVIEYGEEYGELLDGATGEGITKHDLVCVACETNPAHRVKMVPLDLVKKLVEDAYEEGWKTGWNKSGAPPSIWFPASKAKAALDKLERE